jgi:FKBP-type peptidyl-prolyl cis-trans isomerase SlyD
MNADNQPQSVADDVVVSIDYSLTVNGEVIDSSKEEGPLAFLQGHGNIIPGLERELAGMHVGDNKKVVVAPKDGYGEYDDAAVMEVPRGQFPAEIPLEKGVELHVTDEDGDSVHAVIVEVREDAVVLDTNHPLADETLHFDVTVVGLRAATAEELAHGHVHGDHGHHH